MMIKKRTILGMAVALTLSSAAFSQSTDFPQKGIHIINPFPPGSPVESTGRILAMHLEKEWKKYVVLESRNGAGGTVGANYVAKSEPDGHTLLVTTSSPITFAPAVYPKLPYDPVKDLTPVWGGVIPPGQAITINSALPFETLGELVAHAKEKPGVLSYASSGVGTGQHFGGELFKVRTGTNIMHVPYRGGAPAANDLVAGHVDMMFDSLVNQLPHIQSGRVRALAIMRNKRDNRLPDVPTASEAGVEGVELVSWITLFAPASTPPEVLKMIRETTARVMSQPEAIKQLSQVFGDVQTQTVEELLESIPKDVETYIDIAKRAKISESN